MNNVVLSRTVYVLVMDISTLASNQNLIFQKKNCLVSFCRSLLYLRCENNCCKDRRKYSLTKSTSNVLSTFIHFFLSTNKLEDPHLNLLYLIPFKLTLEIVVPCAPFVPFIFPFALL